MKRFIWIILAVLLIGGATMYFYTKKSSAPISQMVVYKNLIKVKDPLPNKLISSPLTIKGEARGFWFFEASFPVKLLDVNGKEITLDPPYIMTSNEWMTENFVPFESTHTFEKPQTATGTLILQKDNPSGLPQHDDSVSIPVRFE